MYPLTPRVQLSVLPGPVQTPTPAPGRFTAVQCTAAAPLAPVPARVRGIRAGSGGSVLVLDAAGDPVTRVAWSVPTDLEADRALTDAGWQRLSPWSTDGSGRRCTRVVALPALVATHADLLADAPDAR
ncbi:hypothetical protein [Nakamurella endophytica]|nr:hypothetical protein [Nakamurella endophytica]